jgi:hypothetical protein
MIRPQASVRPEPWNTKNSWLVASAVVVMLPLTIRTKLASSAGLVAGPGSFIFSLTSSGRIPLVVRSKNSGEKDW